MKKKILFINGHLDSGGCERSLIDVLKKLDYKKYEVDLLLLEHTGDYLEEVPEEVNIKVYSLDNAFGRLVPCLVRAIRKKDWFSFWFRVEYICGTKVSRHFMVCMRKLFKDLRKSYDIVIAYRPGICTELAAFTFQANKKISWWHHGEMNLSYHEIKSLDMAYKKMDSIVAVSNSSKKLLEEQFADIKKKLYVVSNMIDPVELIKKARKYMPVEFQNTKFKIVSVGRMTPENTAVLFSAPSETGKSTQAGLWEKYRGTWTVNGDRSLLIREEDGWYANGWPVCGSSEICNNKSYPVRAIVMLSQAKENRISRLKGLEALRKVMEQITINAWNSEFQIQAMDELEILLKEVPVYHLECDISEDAVRCLEDVLAGGRGEE